jgi:pyruvate/2-oxoglutarate dehydrogenase complex dihydrolipoamide acyltransferase (E2) component
MLRSSLGRPKRLNATRRALMWWFGTPQHAHQNASASFDVGQALAYLDGLNAARGEQPKVSLTHLLGAAIARTLVDHPLANARIVGWRMYQPEHVGIAMPVSLVGFDGAKRGELSMAVVPAVERLSLRQLAQRTTRAVSGERSGTGANPVVEAIFGLAGRAPMTLVRPALGVLAGSLKHRLPAALFWSQAPITTALTNPGPAIGTIPGGLARGLALSLPARGLSVTTIWGMAAIQDEVRSWQGEICVRPCLPLMLCFDHRAVDGILGGRLMARVGEILLDPAAVFGDDGERVP